MSDPFAPTRAPEHPRTKTGRAPWSAVAMFVGRRVLALVVLPLLMTALFSLADVGFGHGLPWWAIAAGSAATGLVFVPTTAVYVWGRFLSSRDDPKALLLGSGERFDRVAYRRVAYASIVERVVGTLLLLAMMLGLLRYGWLLGAITSPLLLLASAYNAYLVYVAWHAVHAMIAHAEHDNDNVLMHTGALAKAWIGARGRESMLVPRASAQLRKGDPAGALATLDKVKNPKAVFADLLRAQILVGQGQLGPAREVAARTPTNLGERLGIEACIALVALHEGAPGIVLARGAAWKEFENELPAEVAAQFDLWTAAAHTLNGDLPAAHAALVRSGIDLAERAWIGVAWPLVWGLLQRAATG